MVQEIAAASSFTPFTLADVKTTAWLVENKKFKTRIKGLVLSSNLDTSSVSAEVETIKTVVDQKNISEATDETILGEPFVKISQSRNLEI